MKINDINYFFPEHDDLSFGAVGCLLQVLKNRSICCKYEFGYCWASFVKEYEDGSLEAVVKDQGQSAKRVVLQPVTGITVKKEDKDKKYHLSHEAAKKLLWKIEHESSVRDSVLGFSFTLDDIVPVVKTIRTDCFEDILSKFRTEKSVYTKNLLDYIERAQSIIEETKNKIKAL